MGLAVPMDLGRCLVVDFLLMFIKLFELKNEEDITDLTLHLINDAGNNGRKPALILARLILDIDCFQRYD